MGACSWSGKADCGCSEFPYLVNGRMPASCEEKLTIATAEAHMGRISPELTAEVKRWVAAGRPRLDKWAGENDES